VILRLAVLVEHRLVTDRRTDTEPWLIASRGKNVSFTRLLSVPLFAHPNTHAFNGPLSGTTRISRYQEGKTNLDFTEARDREWQWHQLGCVQVCTSLQTDNHASTPPLSFFTGRMPFLPPNQQCQSTEGTLLILNGSLILRTIYLNLLK